MNIGRTTSFFGCFLVGILMSKNNYDKIDVFCFPSSLCRMKRQGKHFLRFYHGCTAKKYKFFTFLLVLIFCLKIMNYFLCNLYNFVHFVFLFLWILCWASNSYIEIENMYSIKMDILLLSILLILIFWVKRSKYHFEIISRLMVCSW